MTIKEFKELQRASYKSLDTEEHIDIYFNRPIGLAFALLWKKLGVTPNMVTVMSLFLGAGAGYMFLQTDLLSNICGVLFLTFANFCDSTDGQLARLTNQKTLLGRVLDGIASNIWFIFCYVAIATRLCTELIPGTDIHWGVGSFLLCAIAGFGCHSTQARLADYYRQIHLFFLLGKEGSEFATSESQKVVLEEFKAKKSIIGTLFFTNYVTYCRQQEKTTPQFQKLKALLENKYNGWENTPQTLREEIRTKSLPLMKWANFLTHNWRAFTMFFACCINRPWIYPLAEMTVFMVAYIYMHKTHENMCKEIYERESND